MAPPSLAPPPALARAALASCAAGLALAACAGASAPAPAPAATPVVIATPPLGPDDLEVARVNGRAVWSSCVAAQAQGLADGRPAGDAERRARALDQCIAFELLAQAAEARGAAAAPEVAEATRTAAVSRLVETEFERRYQRPDDLRAAMDIVMKRNDWRMHILQLRASTFARFVVPTGAPAELDARARALAERLAGELTGEAGLYGVHVAEAARRIAAGSDVTVETADVRPMHQDDLVDAYARALYAIPEVGRTTPAVRTPWGWDVIVWTGGVEARERSRDEVIAELFPEVRRHQFKLWVSQLGKRLGVAIEIDDAEITRRLDTGAGDDAPPAAPTASGGGAP